MTQLTQSVRNPAIIVAAGLFLSVVTQLLYVALLSGVGMVEGLVLRSTIWTTELLLFTGIAVSALVALVRATSLQFVWAAIAVAGIMNMIQVGIGLSMFLPANNAGEDFAPLMGTVLAGSFLFYFLAKFLIGIAAVLIGLSLFSGGAGLGKVVGIVSVIVGIIAVALNGAALPLQLGAVPLAGASGAAATLIAAIAIWMQTKAE